MTLLREGEEGKELFIERAVRCAAINVMTDDGNADGSGMNSRYMTKIESKTKFNTNPTDAYCPFA